MPEQIPATYLYVLAIAFGSILVLARIVEAMVIKKRRNGGTGPDTCPLFDEKKWQAFQELLLKKMDADRDSDCKRWQGLMDTLGRKMDNVGESIDRGFTNLGDQFERMAERSKESFSSIGECNRGIKSDIASIRGIVLEIKAGRPD